MAKPLSLDLRKRVVRGYEDTDATLAQVAERFHVGVATVKRWVNRCRKTGSLAPKPHGGGPEPLVDEQGLSLLCDLIADKPDATRAEIARAYGLVTGIELSVATVGRELRRLGFSRKKRLSMPPSEKPRP